MSAYEAMEKSRDTKSLISYMILLPVTIVILVIIMVLFVVIHVNDRPKGISETAQNSSGYVTYVSAEDEKKLLTIASSKTPLGNDYKPDIRDYDGVKYDSILEEPLTEMIEAAKKDGVSLKLSGGYISSAEQDELYKAETQRLINEKDYSRVKAENEAEKTVPRGGMSDRQTGLSVEFYSDGNFAESNEYSWLVMHANEYGFIQRYTEPKEDKTKVKANASLFRYVGKENADKILMLDMSLDEYAEYVNSR